MRVIYETEQEAVDADALALEAHKADLADRGLLTEAHDITTHAFSEATKRLDGKWDIVACEHYDYGSATIEEYDPANYPDIDVD